jgi:hypothetical protein
MFPFHTGSSNVGPTWFSSVPAGKSRDGIATAECYRTCRFMNCPVAQVVRHWCLTATLRVESRVTSSHSWWRKWSRFLSVFILFSPANHHSTIAVYSCTTPPPRCAIAVTTQHSITTLVFKLWASSLTRRLARYGVRKQD